MTSTKKKATRGAARRSRKGAKEVGPGAKRPTESRRELEDAAPDGAAEVDEPEAEHSEQRESVGFTEPDAEPEREFH